MYKHDRHKLALVYIGGDLRDNVTGSVTKHGAHFNTGEKERQSWGHAGPPYRDGGPFLARKSELRLKTKSWSGTIPYLGGRYSWSGDFTSWPHPGANLLLAPPTIPQTTMTSMGTKGIEQASPGKPIVNSLQFLGELKDVGPMFKNAHKFASDPVGSLQRAVEYTRVARSIGKGYLEYQFGWKPFVNDLRDMVMAVDRQHAFLSRLRRENGRNIRFGTIVKNVTDVQSTTVEGYGYFYPAPHSAMFANGGKGKRTTVVKTKQKFWVKGAYRYFIPDIQSKTWSSRALLKMLGANPTPSVVYELTPWSWLIDYFSSLGSVVNNLSGNAAENLVFRYCFAMGQQETETTQSTDWTLWNGSPMHAEWTLTASTKQRLPASPFGFGIDTSGLSTKQTAILAALGMARS